ncbi:MAG: ATP-binding protein [Pseudomonadota bacterium]
MRFGITKKFLFAFLTLSLLPLVILSLYARQKVVQVGEEAFSTTREELVRNASTLLEARARAIAQQVALFLQGSADDLRTLSYLPTDPIVYTGFYQSHQRTIWIRVGDNGASQEIRRPIPLYKEITFAGPDGIERIRIFDAATYDTRRDLNRPFWGPFGEEDYFNQAKALPRGALYVSHLLGRHVREAEQLQGAAGVETAVGGASYDGILRFAMPAYRGPVFAGVVSLALDHRHLMEYTQHVLPLGNREVVFPSYSSGNYAFLFDDAGWIITHPKYWDIRGYDRETGRLVDPTGMDYNESAMKAGYVPFNLLHVPFIHTNYRHVAQEVLAGRSGVTQTASVGGVSRVLAYAPIAFAHGEYRKTGYFGGVTLGAQTDIFHKAVNQSAQRLADGLAHTVRHFAVIILIAGGIVGIIAVILARSFTRPILMLTDKIKEISQGRFDFSVNIHSGDELEILARNFEKMGRELKQKQGDLVLSLEDLKTTKNEIETYSLRLERQVDILKTIHAFSHYLSANFSREEVLDVIVRTCVEGIGFDRALVYLHNKESDRLECVKTYGFDPVVESLARENSYHLTDDDCAQTRVFRSSKPCLVENVTDAVSLTPLDLAIARQSNALSYGFAPVRIGERTIGVLGADYASARKRITTEEMESLKIIANEAGMALERAQLLHKTVAERDFIESIFANMLSGLLVVDHGGRIRSANIKAEEILEAPIRARIGEGAATVLGAFPELLRQITDAITTGKNTNADFQITTAANRQVFLETAVSILNDPQIPDNRSVLLIFRDISRRKRMEQHLNRSDRLVSLGTLAAGIAHEIRNPLTGISLLLDDLHDRMANRTDERLMMQSALEEIEKLEKIVTELLQYASKPTSLLVPKDLDKVIDTSLFFVHKQCAKQGVSLVRTRAERLPPVKLDPEKIKQAILNILLNALHVVGEGGSIHITTRRVAQLDILSGKSGVELSITDTGPGIAPEDINYIFDPFFTRNPEGSGLGLSITHTIIEEHQGKIVADSEPGRGATFRIYFPLADDKDDA